MGKKKLDGLKKETFELFCACQLTRTDICKGLGVNPDTLNSWVKRNYDGRTFSAVYEEKKMMGNLSIRGAGFKMAKTNPTMNIFWAKYLGMTESQTDERRKQEKHEKELEQLELEIERKKLELEKLRIETEAMRNHSNSNDVVYIIDNIPKDEKIQEVDAT